MFIYLNKFNVQQFRLIFNNNYFGYAIKIVLFFYNLGFRKCGAFRSLTFFVFGKFYDYKFLDNFPSDLTQFKN